MAAEELETAESFFSPSTPRQLFQVQALRAEIALVEGDLSAAEAAYVGGLPQAKMWLNLGRFEWSAMANHSPSRDLIARVQIARGELRKAIETYRALNTPGPESKWTSWLEPRYVLEEARLYDRLGEAEAARSAYERFLKLWKNADADRPELAEAREYLEGAR